MATTRTKQPARARRAPAKKPEAPAGWYSLLPGEPPQWAPYVYFRAGEHEQAFTPDECKKLLDYADRLTAVKGTIQGGTEDRKVRDADVRVVPVDPEVMWFYDKLMVAARHGNWWHFDLTHLLNIEVLRYRAGQHYVSHMDLGPGFATRKISLSVQLSDPADYKGGDLELSFGAKPEKMPKEQGSIVVFPSWTMHRVTPVKSGERRAATAWVQGPTFR